MRNFLLLTTACICCLNLTGFAQQNDRYEILDSLLRLLKTDKADTNKLIHLNKISRSYIDINNYDSALFYANAVRQQSVQFLKEAANPLAKKTILKAEAISYSNEGTICFEQGNYPGALKNHSSALKLFSVTGNKKAEASTYNNIGLVNYDLGNFPEALKNHFIALKIYEGIDNKQGIASACINIGNVYYAQKKYPEALKNLSAALKMKEEIGDQRGQGNAHNSIGLVYYDQRNFPEALKHHFAALKIREESNDVLGVSASYNNIGIIYVHQENYSEGLKNMLAALKIEEEIGDSAGIASTYVNIGTILRMQKKYNEAKTYLLKAEKLAKATGQKTYLKDVYSEFTDLDSTMHNFQDAYEHHKLFISYRDSLVNEETREKTIQSQMTYDFEKKEAIAEVEHQKELETQQVLSEEKSRKQKLVIAFVIIGLMVVLIFSGFILRSLRVTKRQKNTIEEQKNIVEQQKHLVEEHQKEIIDSITYAKRLQQAILPSIEEIKKHIPDQFVLYKPKDIVAGDFYWFHVADDLTFIAAADSTGHGVPGAMVSVVCSNALNRSVDEFNLRDTGKILDKTRELVLETFAKSGEEIKDGMDISLLCIDKTKKQIHWSGANNQLWYLSPSNDNLNAVMNEIKANKQPIGKTDNPKPFTTHTLELKKGDIYYLMTDGYPDQFGGPKGKKYKYKTLEEKLISTGNLSLNEQHDELMQSFNDWKGDQEQVDDVTIIGIRI